VKIEQVLYTNPNKQLKQRDFLEGKNETPKKQTISSDSAYDVATSFSGELAFKQRSRR